MGLTAKQLRACGNLECKVSTGICGSITFGSGELDEFGYWEHPCSICARVWEENYPADAPCWPFKKEDNDK